MAEKLPVIIDNRRPNTVVNALRRLLGSLQQEDVTISMSESSSYSERTDHRYRFMRVCSDGGRR